MLCCLKAMPKAEGLLVDAVDALLAFGREALVKTCHLGGG
jgi:hypothetical protein